MFRKAQLFPCGLVVGASYLAANLKTSFALSRPLRTLAVLLLLSAITIIAHAILTSRARSPKQNGYAAIPLNDKSKNGSRDASPIAQGRKNTQRGSLGTRAIAGLLLVLLVAIISRGLIHQRIVKNIECAGPSAVAFLPLVIALVHGLRGNLSERHAARPLRERALQFTLHGPTRYILPSFLLSIASYSVTLSTSTIRSTYICPLVHGTASMIRWLQFLGFCFDCAIVLALYGLLDEDVAHDDDTTHGLQRSAKKNMLVGVTFAASSLELAVTGGIAYAAFPEHREWLLNASPEYIRSLSVLSFVIPFTVLCFLCTIQLYGFMSATLILSFSAAYTYIFQALGIDVSCDFPPKSTTGLIICLLLLTKALLLYLIAEPATKEFARPKLPMRFGRYQTILAGFLFTIFVSGLGYRSNAQRSQISDHPITTLIGLANEAHTQWAAQAHQSRSLAAAVTNYQKRYSRDPPPGFDIWYEYAMNASSIVIDDFDNIESDLLPFSSISPMELRKRTAEVLKENNGLGGIQIRGGKVEVFVNVPGTHRWMMDGTASMIEKFAKFLPDMDLVMNLNDECRVAVPYAKLQEAYAKRELYPDHSALVNSTDWSSKRGLSWPKYWEIDRDTPPYFRGVGFNPTFHQYGSIACPPSASARRQHYRNLGELCTECAEPHSMGAFVSNWTLSASPCHQPDLAHLHGLHLSPAAFWSTHALVPIFSQSKAAGYADIRYPSAWNYLDKAKYETDNEFPDDPFGKKENKLFWRGATSEGVSAGTGAWKGMARQRIVHLLNNETATQPILLPPKNNIQGKPSYRLQTPKKIKRNLKTKMDVHFTGEIVRCGDPDCPDQAAEFEFVEHVDFKQHWRNKFLFDTDGAGFSGRFIPFLQSNSVPFKTAIFREWYEGRLTAWKHFVPVDLRLTDLWSSLAYFGGYDGVRRMQAREEEAEAIGKEGRDWTNKVLRKDDMEVYMFRLLLEWGRLTDEKREKVGLRLKEDGSKAVGENER